jgi:hypothetical protein
VTTTSTSDVATFDAHELAPARRWAPMSTLFGLAFVVAGVRIGLARLDDNSFLWHLRTGRLILDSGVPHEDVYSYTVPGAKWIAQSWLAEVVYAWLEQSFGAFAIRVLMGVVGGAIGWGMWQLALRNAGDRLRAAGIALVAFVLALNVFAERPLSFGLLAAIGLVVLVEQPDSLLGRRPLVSLPALFWLWGNTHGSMSLGYGYLALHLLGRWMEGASPWRPGRERTLLLASILSAVVLCANPYGVSLLIFPFDLVSRGEVLSKVMEWMSPSLRSPLGMAFAAWLVVVLALLGCTRRRPGRRDLLIGIVFVLMGFWAQRNVGLTAIFTLPIAARLVAAPPRREDANPRFVVACGALLVGLVALFVTTAAAEPDFDLRDYPTRAMAFLDEEGKLGQPIFATDRDGGFIIAKYWPRQTVFLDDRFDMYPGSVVEEYESITDVQRDWRDTIAKYDIRLVVWAKDAPLAQVLAESDDWERIYTDRRFVVYERS